MKTYRVVYKTPNQLANWMDFSNKKTAKDWARRYVRNAGEYATAECYVIDERASRQSAEPVWTLSA